MLTEITIENFALIDKVRLQFGAGLNVLTGETGAGKSIVIDAVEAVLGGRASADYVRTGCDRAVVEAVFDLSGNPGRVRALSDMGVELDDDSLLVVRRELSRGGRSSVRLNGRPATAGMLREAMTGLIDLHGQHEHQSLLDPDRHLELLDQFGGEPLLAIRHRVAVVHQNLAAVERDLRGLVGDEKDRLRREDLLKYQLEELDRAKLRAGEEEDLLAERRILMGAEKLKLAAQRSYAMLYEGDQRQLSVTDLLARIGSELGEAARIDPSLQPVIELLQTAGYQLEEAARTLGNYREKVEYDPERLEAIEARLDMIAGLKRKYGNTIDEILSYGQTVRDELVRLSNAEEMAADLRARRKVLGAELAGAAAELTDQRKSVALELALRVESELAGLGMGKARFEVGITPDQAGGEEWAGVGPAGRDRVEFLLSPNPGEPLKPLVKIVSGGEMSRIMLAIKVVLARVDGVPTLIFDEIDAGISGRAAQAVSEKLSLLSAESQVLCVTHLPQIAAMADDHFLISKEEADGRTITRVLSLDDEGRILEIARMIGGSDLTRLTLDHAGEMVGRAHSTKETLRSAWRSQSEVAVTELEG